MSKNCSSTNTPNKKRRRSSKQSPLNSQVHKKANTLASPVNTETMASHGGQPPVMSISDNDVARIALAVKQLIIADFHTIIDEKQKHLVDEIDTLKQKVHDLEMNQQDEIGHLKNQVSYLQDRCEDLEQHSRKQCVRFSGVPVRPGENTDQVIIDIAQAIGVTLEPKDILISHRTGKNVPRQIIARVPNHNLKKKLLKAAKLTKDIPDLKGISINQDLTSTRSKIFYEARQLVKKNKIKATFVVDGKIYIYDLKDSRYIVRNRADFDKTLNIIATKMDVEEEKEDEVAA